MAQRVIRVRFEVEDKGSRQINAAAKRMRNALKGVADQARRTSGAINKSMAATSKGMKKNQQQMKKSTGIMAASWKSLIAVMSVAVLGKVAKDIILAGVEMERLQAFVKAQAGIAAQDFLKVPAGMVLTGDHRGSQLP